MFNINIINRMLSNILEIKTRNDELVPIQSIYIDNPLTFNLMLNDSKVTPRCTHRVKYKCIKCETPNLIPLSLFIKKMRNGVECCKYCKDVVEPIDSNVLEQIQCEFFKKNLTIEEYIHLENSIQSFQGGKFKLPGEFTFIPVCKKNGKFTSQMYDASRNVYEDFVDLKLVCNGCNKIFGCQNSTNLKNVLKIKCKNCNTSRALKFGVVKNHIENDVVYKLNYELDFIVACNKACIVVENYGDQFYLPQFDKKIGIKHKTQKRFRNVDTSTTIVYSDDIVHQVNKLVKILNQK